MGRGRTRLICALAGATLLPGLALLCRGHPGSALPPHESLPWWAAMSFALAAVIDRRG